MSRNFISSSSENLFRRFSGNAFKSSWQNFLRSSPKNYIRSSFVNNLRTYSRIPSRVLRIYHSITNFLRISCDYRNTAENFFRSTSNISSGVSQVISRVIPLRFLKVTSVILPKSIGFFREFLDKCLLEFILEAITGFSSGVPGGIYFRIIFLNSAGSIVLLTILLKL